MKRPAAAQFDLRLRLTTCSIDPQSEGVMTCSSPQPSIHRDIRGAVSKLNGGTMAAVGDEGVPATSTLKTKRQGHDTRKQRRRQPTLSFEDCSAKVSLMLVDEVVSLPTPICVRSTKELIEAGAAPWQGLAGRGWAVLCCGGRVSGESSGAAVWDRRRRCEDCETWYMECARSLDLFETEPVEYQSRDPRSGHW